MAPPRLYPEYVSDILLYHVITSYKTTWNHNPQNQSLQICLYHYSSQPGPSRVAPPTPTSEDTTPLIPTDHTRTVANSHSSQQYGVAVNLGEMLHQIWFEKLVHVRQRNIADVCRN